MSLKINLSILCFFVLVSCLLACKKPSDPPPSPSPSPSPSPTPSPTPSSEATPLDKHLPSPAISNLGDIGKNYRMGEAIVEENVVMIPILLEKDPLTKQTDYLSLEEALDQKLVTIKELDGGGNVPQLQLKSKTDKTIFISFGTIVTGGKQDRMIKENLVVKGHEKRKLNVFCIESGRWSPSADSKQQFKGNYKSASNKIKADVERGAPQGEVWRQVSSENTKLGNNDKGSNFQGVYKTETYKKKQASLEKIKKQIASQKNIVGVIGMVNGEIAGLEIYASPAYFKKMWQQIYESYVIDASTKETVKIDDIKVINSSVNDFLANIKNCNIKKEKKENSLQYAMDNEKVVGRITLDDKNNQVIYWNLYPKTKQDSNSNKNRNRQATEWSHEGESPGNIISPEWGSNEQSVNVESIHE